MGSATDNSSGWTEITGQVTAPATATSVFLGFESYEATGEIHYFDDVTITDDSVGSAINIGTSNAYSVSLGNSATTGGLTLQNEGITDTLTGSATAPNDIIATSTNTDGAFQIQDSTGADSFEVSTASGDIANAGAITGGEVNDIKTDTTGSTYTETSSAVGYYLSATDGTTAGNINTTFNITGLPATDGTIVGITAVDIKGTTGASETHTVYIKINTSQTIATLVQTGTTGATTQRSFTIMRQDGTWQVIGEGTFGAVTTSSSTSTTADYAEWIDYSGDTQPQPGDVLTVGSDPTSVQDSSRPYDNDLMGVVSTTPYEVGGADDGHSVILALTGRVPVKVSLENGPIEPGDYLTSSSTPGVAMKATKPGEIIGTALEAYDGTQSSNEVMTQLHVGYADPTDGQSANQIQGDESVSGSLNISGDISTNGDLSVAGTTTTQNLTVTGSASIASLSVVGSTSTTTLTVSGLATVETLTVAGSAQINGDLTLGGHFITSGNTPTTTVDTQNAGSTAVCTVDGNDTSGTVNNSA